MRGGARGPTQAYLQHNEKRASQRTLHGQDLHGPVAHPVAVSYRSHAGRRRGSEGGASPVRREARAKADDPGAWLLDVS